MSIPFSLQLQLSWQEPEFLLEQRGSRLSQKVRSLLACRGSLTRHLEAVSGQAVGVRLLHQEWLAAEAAFALPIQPSVWAGLPPLPARGAILVRDAWLAVGDEARIFAHSQVAAGDLPTEQRQAIEAGDQPLGAIFLERQGAVDRLDLALSLASAPDLAQGLGQPADALFWCRRSLLIVATEPRARLLEVFLPE